MGAKRSLLQPPWVQENQKPRPGVPLGSRLRTGPSRNNTGYTGVTHTVESGHSGNVFYDVYQVAYIDFTTGKKNNNSRVKTISCSTSSF